MSFWRSLVFKEVFRVVFFWVGVGGGVFICGIFCFWELGFFVFVVVVGLGLVGVCCG